jgi:hypothetical protein
MGNILESDNAEVVAACSESNRSVWLPVLEQIRGTMIRVQEVGAHKVKRVRYRVAHELAQFASIMQLQGC